MGHHHLRVGKWMGKPQFQWLLMAAEFRQFGGILWFLATAFEARKQDPKHVTVLLKEIEICRFSVDQQTEKITLIGSSKTRFHTLNGACAFFETG